MTFHFQQSQTYKIHTKLLTEDEDDTDFYGVLLSPLTTTSQTISTTDIPLASPATQLADSSLLQLHIQSPVSTTRSMPQQFIFPPTEISTKYAKGKRLSGPPVSREVKRLAHQHNQSSEQTKSLTHITYIGEANTDSTTLAQFSSVDQPKLDIRKELPNFYNNSSLKDWQERTIYTPDLNYKSPTTGLTRTDLYVFAIDANHETYSQRARDSYHRALKKTQTPIERFYPQLWSSENAPHTGHPVITREQLEVLPFHKEPYENALRIERVPLDTFQKVAPAIPEPIIPLHQNPPAQQHSLSQEASHLLQCSESIKFFEAVFRPYEFNSIHQQMRIFRKQSNRLKWKEPTYEEGHHLLSYPTIWNILPEICIHSHGHTSGSIARRSLPTTLEQEKALTKNCMLRSLYAYSSGWIRNIAARIRKLSLSPTVYHLSQKHRKISVM